jgi:hypothetical protein
VKAASGRLDVDLRIDGPRSAPRPRGDVVLSDASLTLAATGIAYEHIQGRLSADGTRMVVQQLEAKAGDGTADVTGVIQLAPPVRSLDLQVRVKDFFAVKQTAYEATVSGDVKVGGNLAAPDVTGTLEVDHALVRPAALPASEPVVPDDTTIVVVGRPVKAVEAAPSGPDDRRIDAARRHDRGGAERLDPPRRRRDRARRQAPGDEDARPADRDHRRHPARARLVRVPGPALPARAGEPHRVRRPGAARADVRHHGGPHDAGVSYRGAHHGLGGEADPGADLDPALEKADILAVLLFGKRTQDLGRGESDALQQKALALAAGYVVPELRTSVMNTLGLETLEVQMPEGVQPGKVSAGRYVSDDVFVSLGQEFGRRARRSSASSTTSAGEFSCAPRRRRAGTARSTCSGDTAIERRLRDGDGRRRRRGRRRRDPGLPAVPTSSRRRTAPRAILAGALTGLVAVAFAELLAAGERLRAAVIGAGGFTSLVGSMALGAVGAGIAVSLVRAVAPETAGSGIPT